MIAREIAKLKTTTHELRKFGLVVGGVLALIGVWLCWRGHGSWAYVLGVAGALVGLGLVWPAALKWPYLVWMSLGILLGTGVSTVLLTVLYFSLVTPMGLLARALGKDFMRRRLEPEATSYWLRRTNPGPRKPREYEQQF